MCDALILELEFMMILSLGDKKMSVPDSLNFPSGSTGFVFLANETWRAIRNFHGNMSGKLVRG